MSGFRTIFLLLPTVLLAALTQSGCAPSSGNLAASPTSLSFGNVVLGSNSHQTLTLTNSGTAPSTVTQAAASGAGFNFKGPSLPMTLAAGQSITFTTSFAPTAMGNASGSLSITTSQTSSPQFTDGSMPVGQSTTTHMETVSMSGTGVPVGPSITTQVASQTVTVGQTATFSVAASSESPLSYQWQKNGTAISGATATTYTTPATAISDSGSQFSVVVSNSTGSVTSNTATLTVTAAAVAPSITTQPASQTVTVGQTATFLVTTTGTAPLSYQWQKNNAAISGATSASYTTPPTVTSDSGSQFSVVISNSTGSVTSNTATLTVTAAAVAPSITTQPASQTVTVGQTATFLVTTTGTAPLSYQWQKNNAAISGATSASYTTPPTVTSDSGSQFAVIVSNSTGSVTSNAATLTVNATPVAITVSPSNVTVTVGNTQQFVGTVTGSSNTAVAWTLKGAGCTGAACGTISSSGLYIPPSSVPSPAAVTVTAISVADPTKSASASVAIVAAVAVLLSISPASASVPTSGTQLFNASVTGTSNTAVNWTVTGAGCSGSSCGTIATSASSAVYSAPTVAPSPASVNVTATSVADPTKSASASATIVPVVAVTVGPTGASVPTGTTQQFTASVTGTSNTAVAWSVAGTGCSGAACGTIGSSGLYTAPASVPSPASVTITATSAADQTKSGAANSTIVSSAKAGPVLPTLPQASVDITMPVQSGTVRNVAAGNAAGFQAAINAATCGDTIVVVAGSTYTGNFTIPNKVCSGWILIESSALASLPPSGTRVSGACTAGTPPATVCPPPSTTNMATIVSGIADTPTF
ncbi:MAG: choice-of-anchor D domain-containing protein, partial [Candidatus Acidiferrales bacterium]